MACVRSTMTINKRMRDLKYNPCAHSNTFEKWYDYFVIKRLTILVPIFLLAHPESCKIIRSLGNAKLTDY